VNVQGTGQLGGLKKQIQAAGIDPSRINFTNLPPLAKIGNAKGTGALDGPRWARAISVPTPYCHRHGWLRVSQAPNTPQKTECREHGTFQEQHQERPNYLNLNVFYGPVPYVPYF
jgi:hypothetical protein